VHGTGKKAEHKVPRKKGSLASLKKVIGDVLGISLQYDEKSSRGRRKEYVRAGP